MIEIEYCNDETLEIKEEIMKVQGTTGEEHNVEYQPKFCTVDIKETDHFSVNILSNRKKQKNQDPKQEPKKNYKCEKCARTYKYKKTLTFHQKFECGVLRQFSCKFCAKRFAQKCNMNLHIASVHQKKKQVPAKGQFPCNFCGYETNQEENLSKHISLHHVGRRNQETNLQPSRTSYNCDECSRSYTWLSGLCRHKRLEHSSFKPQFTCDICGYKSNRKATLKKHITTLHSQTSKSRYKCDKCSRSYTWLSALNRHNQLDHAAVKRQFICAHCGHQTNQKINLLKHIASRHLK
ncbi:zinc finger protein 676-like isoform X1 [Belonocnema kinseyi]|uniref:zinc finger protein 676-like isoform X1 n=1 Tax=Belonocnema kinseyi TaxID=2817044 RepID=UPI00143D70A9|nr:zinc finger protein 676-like isoform X1 [Belonocnema kinseyi]